MRVDWGPLWLWIWLPTVNMVPSTAMDRALQPRLGARVLVRADPETLPIRQVDAKAAWAVVATLWLHVRFEILYGLVKLKQWVVLVDGFATRPAHPHADVLTFGFWIFNRDWWQLWRPIAEKIVPVGIEPSRHTLSAHQVNTRATDHDHARRRIWHLELHDGRRDDVPICVDVIHLEKLSHVVPRDALLIHGTRQSRVRLLVPLDSAFWTC